MPISSDRSAGLQVGQLGSIGSNQIPNGVGDLMQAFKDGFVTVDDINKRTRSNINDSSQLATNLQAQDIQRRLAPGAADNAALGQDVQHAQLLGQADIVPKQSAIASQILQDEKDEISPDPAVRQAAMQRKTERQYQQLFGQLPDQIDVPTKTTPASFEVWYQHSKAPNIASGITTPGVNGAPDTVTPMDDTAIKTSPQTQAEYQAYVASTKSQPVVKGSQEYFDALRNQIQAKTLGNDIQAAQVKAIPSVLEQRAKQDAEAPGKAAASTDNLRKEYSALPELHDFRKVDAAYNKLKTATDPKDTPTPLRDQAAIFSWMKILDPGSTVREGEYASVKNARGIPDTIKNFYNQALTGQILTPEQRAELRSAAEPVYLGQVQNLAPRIRQFQAQENALRAPGQVVPPEDAALLQRISGSGGIGAPPASSLGALEGKTIKTKDGRTGVVTKAPDGTFFLK